MSKRKVKLHSQRRRRSTGQAHCSRQGSSEKNRVQFKVSKDGQPEVVINGDGLPKFLVKAHNAAKQKRLREAVELLDDEAIENIHGIVKTAPARTDVMFVLARTLFEIAKLSDAEDWDKRNQYWYKMSEYWYQKSEYWYKKLLKQCPHALVYNQLGNICKATGRMWEAVRYRRKIVEVEPDNVHFRMTLGTLVILAGKTQEGIDILREAVEKKPESARNHSGLLVNLHYLPKLDHQALFEEHKRWGRLHALPGKAKASHNNNPDPDRRLRIGYISPDFYMHSVSYFIEPVLEAHNRNVVEVYGYGNVLCPDQVTRRLVGKFDHYRNIYGADDEKLVRMIEQDKIDILVELAGHTAGNRLIALAGKPAPVQVIYLGYPNTTGMEQIDYRLTDSLADPPGSQQFYTEQLVSLPDGFLCYRPADYAPSVAPAPAVRNGFITFGTFNNNTKINPVITGLWTEVLKANPGSHLLLKFIGGDDREMREHYLKQFEQFGISRERIEIHGAKNSVDHLGMYSRMDIALDAYPYHGTTTTCEAMWMGVPTVSLVGEHHVSRVGLSILSSVGLEFFATSSPEEYVAKATALASKVEALSKVRSSMRTRMITSRLCNAKGFVQNLEAAYREMWQCWCKKQNAQVKENDLSVCVK